MAQRIDINPKSKIPDIRLNICHLYPDLMDTYGDKGNITTLVKRCQWRGIGVSTSAVTVNEPIKTNQFDLFFFGGGQDQAQEIVGRDLKKKAEALKIAIDEGAVMLSICGGYQLLQNFFQTSGGAKISGLGVFNAYTQASNTRKMNNLLVKINPKLQDQINSCYPTILPSQPHDMLIGFENHSGNTYLQGTTQPLATVTRGSGNNGEDKTEGAFYKNAFGCYLHGSLLPKNPHFADFLIGRALGRKFPNFKLKTLDDTLEWQTHNGLIAKIRSSS